MRGQAVPEALHVHFNGAGGNIGAGKYNDGAKENRLMLATRLADGMASAWNATQKQPLAASDVGWQTVPVRLPVAPHLNEADLLQALRSEPARGYIAKADQLAWVRRCQAGHAIDVACLRLGQTRVLHLPGELFVEYQLAAKAMRPDLHVAMAAYGDYGPGYIGTTVAYPEGGYETGPGASNVAPEVEPVLMDADEEALGGDTLRLARREEGTRSGSPCRSCRGCYRVLRGIVSSTDSSTSSASAVISYGPGRSRRTVFVFNSPPSRQACVMMTGDLLCGESARQWAKMRRLLTPGLPV